MFILFYRSLNRFVELYRVYQNLLLLMGFMDKLETKISLAESSSEKVFGELFEEEIYQILYKNVTFSYGSKIILKNLNLSIFKNQITLIKGASGVGKTTMLDLLIGLYKVKEGQIIINKKNINDINLLKWRQNKIGYVPQDSELFEGTLLDDI
jgi:ABC-type multidrug transport system fused ATPase/permease subunit